MHEEVGDFLLHLELSALTTISKVDVTPDLKWCKVWITILGDIKTQKQVMSQLVKNLRDMQNGINQKLKMKFVPRISFVIDHGEEYADHINQLLKKTNES